MPEQAAAAPPLLLNGTSTARLTQARSAGCPHRPYVTDGPDRAWYYAALAAEEDGTDPVLAQLHGVRADALRYDGAAMDEPVMADVADRDAAWDRAAEEHPEWVTHAMVLVPATAWEVSWAGVGSARVGADVEDFTVAPASELVDGAGTVHPLSKSCPE